MTTTAAFVCSVARQLVLGSLPRSLLESRPTDHRNHEIFRTNVTQRPCFNQLTNMLIEWLNTYSKRISIVFLVVSSTRNNALVTTSLRL